MANLWTESSRPPISVMALPFTAPAAKAMEVEAAAETTVMTATAMAVAVIRQSPSLPYSSASMPGLASTV